MGWKNVKTHYRIGHIVQVRSGNILIGSPYVSELLTISPEGEVSWGSLGPSENDDLERYYVEMTTDPAKLLELIEAPDSFDRSLRVFTFDGAEIIEKECEEYGWPNVTHDGLIQYENEFHPDRAVVVGWAKDNAKLGLEYAQTHLEEAEARLIECRNRLSEKRANLAKLEADYPD